MKKAYYIISVSEANDDIILKTVSFRGKVLDFTPNEIQKIAVESQGVDFLSLIPTEYKEEELITLEFEKLPYSNSNKFTTNVSAILFYEFEDFVLYEITKI